MNTPTLPRPATAAGALGQPPRRTRYGLLRDLDHPREVWAAITPNWYASVMGTGIVATAAASLPLRFPGLHAFATVVWALAVLLLIAVTTATVLHWRRYPQVARGHHTDPVMVHFYGAPPMALLTVGAGTLLLGRDVIGTGVAVGIDWVLWSAGTVAGLVTAVAVPYLRFTRPTGASVSGASAFSGSASGGSASGSSAFSGSAFGGGASGDKVSGDRAFGGWLMPVVPPMVSASTGALLVPHTPAGQARLTLVLVCYAMFGLSLIASLVIITLIWNRLAQHQAGPAPAVPTLWIVLGPLGQSITAANLLGGVAAGVLPAPYGPALQAFGVVYGVPVWGFAVLWFALASAVTIRTARRHLPFSLTWWSFTFPVGTCVTAASGLAEHTGAILFRVTAGLLYAALLVAWAVVATRTTRGSLRGTLFRPASPSPRTP